MFLGGLTMRNQCSKVRCVKRRIGKCKEVVRTYNAIQAAFADMLDKDENIKEFICNYPLSDFSLSDGKYTSDFYCTTNNGDVIIYECVFRKHLNRPHTAKLLDASRCYWMKRGVDWRLVVDEEK